MTIISRIVSLFLLLLPFMGTQAHADDPWPSKPIKLVVPYAPGGGSDVIGRLLAVELTKELGQQVIVDNRPGAGASLGAAIAARAPADGYTLLLGNAASVSATAKLRKVAYDPRTDFAPIAAVAANSTFLVVRKDFPAKNIAELKALALKKPESVSCGTAGLGSGAHMSCEYFAELAGIKLLMVHYKGSSEALNDLIGGRIDIVFDPTALPRIKDGSARLLATRTEGGKRFAGTPDIPSFADQGMPAMTDELWFGVLAPAGTPLPIIDRIAVAVKPFTQSPEVEANLKAYGEFPHYIGPDELKARMAEDWEYFGGLIERHHMRID
jgi:tripartite-type tricarboxylate transporter receptor subunit TctC